MPRDREARNTAESGGAFQQVACRFVGFLRPGVHPHSIAEDRGLRGLRISVSLRNAFFTGRPIILHAPIAAIHPAVQSITPVQRGS